MIHETLNQDVFEGDVMKPEIQDRLLTIGENFYEESGLNIMIQDIILTGSMAAFNYNDFSDFDVHVLVDLPENEKQRAQLFRWKWNEQHNIMIKGHEVECYIQDSKEPHTANGIYSLGNNRWIKVPEHIEQTVTEDEIKAKANEFKFAIDELIKRSESGDSVTNEEVDALLYKVMRLRKDAFEAGENEFSLGNLTFKELRNSGHTGKLMELSLKIYDDSMSMEHRIAVESNQNNNMKILKYTPEVQKQLLSKIEPAPWLHVAVKQEKDGPISRKISYVIYVWDTRAVVEEDTGFSVISTNGVNGVKANDNKQPLKGAKGDWTMQTKHSRKRSMGS